MTGTWQDSTNDNPNSYPTNVTRFARALARSGRVYDTETGQIKLDDDGEPVTEDQIVFYQKGVGTGLLDSLIGGTYSLLGLLCILLAVQVLVGLACQQTCAQLTAFSPTTTRKVTPSSSLAFRGVPTQLEV